MHERGKRKDWMGEMDNIKSQASCASSWPVEWLFYIQIWSKKLYAKWHTLVHHIYRLPVLILQSILGSIHQSPYFTKEKIEVQQY